MNEEEQRREIVKYWLEKAESSLYSAQREYDAGSYDFAINRLNYSAFYAVSALLLKRKVTFKKHSGVRAYFHKEFIKNGIIDIGGVSSMINYLKTDRKVIICLL